MAVKLGRISKLAISLDAGVTFADIGKLVDCSLALTTQEVEFTNHDSAGYREFLAGFIEGTMDGSARYDEANVPQNELIDTFDSTPASTFTSWPNIQLRFRPEEASGEDEYTWNAICTSLTIDTTNEDVDGLSFSFRLTAAPVLFRATQT